MTLKGFHVIFITASVLLCILFGLWAVNQLNETQNTSYLLTAVGSWAAAAGLVVYEILFLKKTNA